MTAATAQTAAPAAAPRLTRIWTALVGLACLAGAIRLVAGRFDHVALILGPFLLGVAAFAVYCGLLGLLVRRLDRWRTLDRRAVLVATAWGGLVATPLAISANTDVGDILGSVFGLGAAADLGPTVVAPLVEEIVKGIGVLAAVVAVGRRLSGPLEAMVLGALSGLGFQFVENLTYAYDGILADPNSDLRGVGLILAGRTLTGLDGHWVYTAFTGLAVGLVVAGAFRSRVRRVASAVALVAVALAAHFLNNSGEVLGPIGVLLASVVALSSLAFTYRYASRAQWRRGAAALAAEPETVATADEREALRTRRTARRDARTCTPPGVRRALQQRQIVLATALLQDRPADGPREAVREARAALPTPDPA